MLEKDLGAHQDDTCESSHSTCMKCNTIYKRFQGHPESQCFEKQMMTIKEKLDESQHKPKRVDGSYNKMVQRFNRQHVNDGYARRSQLSDDVHDGKHTSRLE
jgi:hypothetical protein